VEEAKDSRVSKQSLMHEIQAMQQQFDRDDSELQDE
jgi:hypothetical protein